MQVNINPKINIFALIVLTVFFSFLGLFSVKNASAATFQLSGKITTSSGDAVTGANIDVIDTTINTNAANTTSDSSGNYSVNINGGTYNVQVTPPAGSNFSPTIALSQNISANTVLNFILTPAGTVSLSGHVQDPLGNPVANQHVYLTATGSNTSIVGATTDSSGNYSISASSGTYDLHISGGNTSLSIPQSYQLIAYNYFLTQNTNLDITVPAKKVIVHVQDATGNPISDATLSTNDAYSANGLTISGTVTNAYGDSSFMSTTDGLGNATLWLLPNYSFPYTITAIPPSGSSYSPFVLNNISITNDTSLTITLQKTVILSGHVYDPLGNPVANQQVYLQSGSSIVLKSLTDNFGNYSLQVSSGTYDLHVSGGTSGNSLAIPQGYQLVAFGYSLTQNTVLDITIPAKRVDVHVQDTPGNPVSNIELVTNNAFSSGGLTMGGNITNAYGDSVYVSPVPKTDGLGNATLWLLPNSSSALTITATPPSGSIYSLFVLSNIFITSDQTEIISLQFIHDRPVTTATLSPAADAQGNYSDPTTVTLSATAASGFTIANTYYTIDGGVQQTYSTPFTVSGGGSHTITYWSVDNVGVPESPNTKTFTIHVNQSPSINAISNTTINEGDTYSASGSFTDPDSNSWTATVDYGDGSGVQPLTLSGTNFSLNHVYKDNGTYTVTVSVTDNQGAIGTGTATVTVKNVNPSVGAITAPTSPVQVNTPIAASASLTDAGVLDTHTASWDWGDGNTTTGTVTETNGSGSVSNNHTYTAAGVYTIILTVTDKDGGIGTSTFQYIVIFDPSAGFVTGGGTINSPKGAYTKDPTLTGEANFGFVSKYQKGANVPSGNTEFNFKAADFNFHARSYQWLVIAGSKSQYKGTGTVNGNGDYEFMLTAIDGKISGGGGTDKFRLKVWDKTTNNVIYDNQLAASDNSDLTTTIDSGSIIIHK